MNDDFLTKFYKAPRPEFAEALYQRIIQPSRPRFVPALSTQRMLRNVSIILVAIFLVAACTYYVVSQTPYHKVGGIWLTVQKTQKLEFPPNFGADVVTSAPPECDLSFNEARRSMPFNFLVPTWAPEGFTFTNTICADILSDNLSISWKSADGSSYIYVWIHDLSWYDSVANTDRLEEASAFPVAPHSYKEIQVNGQPAVLIRGDWNMPQTVSEIPSDGKLESQWDKNQALQLYWVDGSVLYRLYSHSDASEEDLIKMAESAR